MDGFVFQVNFPIHEVSTDVIRETLSASSIDWVRAFKEIETDEYRVKIEFECPHSKHKVNYGYETCADLAEIAQLANQFYIWTFLWDSLINAAQAPYPAARGATKDPFELSRNSNRDEW